MQTRFTYPIQLTLKHWFLTPDCHVKMRYSRPLPHECTGLHGLHQSILYVIQVKIYILSHGFYCALWIVPDVYLNAVWHRLNWTQCCRSILMILNSERRILSTSNCFQYIYKTATYAHMHIHIQTHLQMTSTHRHSHSHTQMNENIIYKHKRIECQHKWMPYGRPKHWLLHMYWKLTFSIYWKIFTVPILILNTPTISSEMYLLSLGG